jgi:hypothetical protein
MAHEKADDDEVLRDVELRWLTPFLSPGRGLLGNLSSSYNIIELLGMVRERVFGVKRFN